MTAPRTLTARWIFPVDRDPIPDGTMTIQNDRIVAVEAKGQRQADKDLGNVAILPGLVNAHTHLDLSGLRGLTPPTADFTTWLRQVVNHRRTMSPDQVQLAIQTGLAESLRFGTTLLGDISGQGQSWQTLVQAPLRAVVFHEVLGLPADRASRAWEGVLEWLRTCSNTETCRQGLSPHAPYSVRQSLFEKSATLRCPVAVHLAETGA